MQVYSVTVTLTCPLIYFRRWCTRISTATGYEPRILQFTVLMSSQPVLWLEEAIGSQDGCRLKLTVPEQQCSELLNISGIQHSRQFLCRECHKEHELGFRTTAKSTLNPWLLAE